VQWIKETFRQRTPSGIIYCMSTNDCDRVAEDLRKEHHIRAAAYHAKLDDKLRTDTQRRWSNDEIPVIVATIAFGMGTPHSFRSLAHSLACSTNRPISFSCGLV
jgi:ATP-dependent DNA helicase RecQ